MRTYELPEILEASRPPLAGQRRKRPSVLPNRGLPDTAAQSQPMRLMWLVQQHRDLDDAITALCAAGASDPLQITRLKKRKLRIKDEIARIGE